MASAMTVTKAVRLTDQQVDFMGVVARAIDPARESFAHALRWMIDHFAATYKLQSCDTLPVGLIRAIETGLSCDHNVINDHAVINDHDDHIMIARACDPANQPTNKSKPNGLIASVREATPPLANVQPALEAVSATGSAREAGTEDPTADAKADAVLDAWNEQLEETRRLWNERNATLPDNKRYWIDLLTTAKKCNSTLSAVKGGIARLPRVDDWLDAFERLRQLGPAAVNGARLFNVERLCMRPKDKYEREEYQDVPRSERPMFLERLDQYIDWGQLQAKTKGGYGLHVGRHEEITEPVAAAIPESKPIAPPEDNPDVVDQWRLVLEEIKGRVREGQFGIWFSSMRCVSFDDKLLEVAVPNEHYQNWCRKHFSGVLKESATTVLSVAPRIVFRTYSDTSGESVRESAARKLDESIAQLPPALQKTLSARIPSSSY